MKKLLLMILLSFELNAANIFFISGDNDFTGPEYEGKKAYANQAESLYIKVKEQARESAQTTIIFYDPKGSPFLLWNRSKKVKFEIFYQGKHLAYSSREVDVTNASDLEWIDKNLGKYADREESLFYYYGEHISLEGNNGYDFSHPESKMGIRQLIDIVGLFRRYFQIRGVVLHTCNNANLFLHAMLGQRGVHHILSSQDLIPNNAGNISALFSGSIKERFSKFRDINNESHYPFKWKIYDAVQSFLFYMDLKSFFSSLEYKSDLQKTLAQLSNDSGVELENTFENEVYMYPQEILVSLQDILIYSYSYATEFQTIDELYSRYQDELIDISNLKSFFD